MSTILNKIYKMYILQKVNGVGTTIPPNCKRDENLTF